MLEALKTIQQERVVNIKELQKSPSRHLRGFTRVMRGKQTVGYFLDPEELENFIEDMEAMSSKNFLNSIARARKRKKYVSLAVIKKRYGIS